MAPVGLRRLRDQLGDDARTRALLSAPGFLDALAAVVARLAPGGSWWRARRAERNVTPPGRVRERAADLAKAVRRVEQLAGHPELAPLLCEMVVLPHGVALSDRRVRSALDGIGFLRDKGDEIVRGLPKRGRGRPRDHWRDRFARAVALLVKRAGVRLTKSRQGTFALVLDAALEAAGEDPPKDIFDLVSPAVDALSEKPRLVG